MSLPSPRKQLFATHRRKHIVSSVEDESAVVTAQPRHPPRSQSLSDTHTDTRAHVTSLTPRSQLRMLHPSVDMKPNEGGTTSSTERISKSLIGTSTAMECSHRSNDGACEATPELGSTSRLEALPAHFTETLTMRSGRLAAHRRASLGKATNSASSSGRNMSEHPSAATTSGCGEYDAPADNDCDGDVFIMDLPDTRREVIVINTEIALPYQQHATVRRMSTL